MDRQVGDSEIAIFIIGALYIGIVFLLMVMAILALKIMSGLTEDKRRYRMLSCLGVSEVNRGRRCCMTAGFFFQPLMPVLSSVPMGWLFGRLLQRTAAQDKWEKCILQLFSSLWSSRSSTYYISSPSIRLPSELWCRKQNAEIT